MSRGGAPAQRSPSARPATPAKPPPRTKAVNGGDDDWEEF
jgi:hypothetical protein